MFLTSIKARILAIILSMGLVSIVGFGQLSVLEDQHHTVMLCFMLNIVLAILLGVILFTRILRPIRKLMRIADDFKDGELNQHHEFIEKDEFGILGSEFIDMANQVESHNKKLLEQAALNRIYAPVVAMLAASNDQEMALSEVLAMMHMHLPVFAGAVCLHGRIDNDLLLAAEHGINDDPAVQKKFLHDVSADFELLDHTMSLKYLEDFKLCLDGENKYTRPEYTVIFPILYRQERLGVLLLALEREFSEPELDFVHKLLLTMAVAINDIERYKQLEMLNTELEKNRKQLQEERDVAVEDSITDGLTRIYNRGYFELSRKGFIQHARRSHEPLSLLLIDIDYFKAVNDTFGHPCGDVVLIRVAQVMKRVLRETDFVARYGGEEFICVLPHANMLQAHQAAEKLRLAIAAECFDEMDGKSVTISIGLSALRDHDSDLQAMVERADKSLYQAKETGRNRVVCDDEF